MQLAILHYHLNRGGVTQVIQNHLRALATSPLASEIEQIAILYGGRKKDWPEQIFDGEPPFVLRLVEVPQLEYDEAPSADPQQLAAVLQEVLTRCGLQAEDTMLHVHNHALGKNASLPGAVAELATCGYRELLQVHDFAEDFRPENYRHLATALGTTDHEQLAATLYPQAANIHYAVLNVRDRRVFAAAGLATERLYLLPNPVVDFAGLPEHAVVRATVAQKLQLADGQPLVVYPVRGIRRKNLGEMLLASVLDRGEAMYAVTLAPLNPVEVVDFERWRQLADELALRCRFDTGGSAGVAFLDVLAAADQVLSTSVAEGFGMVFLEAWLAGRPLVGRNLPEITADFAAAGIAFDWLYDRLAIPRRLLDESQVRGDLAAAYQAVCYAYQQPAVDQRELEHRIDELFPDEAIDFAFLSRRLQQDLIRRLAANRVEADRVLAANPRLAAAQQINLNSVGELVERNAALVRRHFSLESAGARLTEVYQAVLKSPARGDIERLPRGKAVLENFLAVRRLHPIRLAPADPS